MTAEPLNLIPVAADGVDLTPENVAALKADARTQFITKTREMNLKHTFNFEEAFDYCIENRKRQKFRESVVKFEERVKALPQAVGPDSYPLEHELAGGMYRRRLTVPAQTLTVTKIHALDHFWFIEKGTVTIWSERGQETHTAPASGITKAGTKRVIWHHDEVVFTTVHRTDHTDLADIEEEVIAKDFDDLELKMRERIAGGGL
jgi:hypothetical protein